jgi:predicted acetyltransferase
VQQKQIERDKMHLEKTNTGLSTKLEEILKDLGNGENGFMGTEFGNETFTIDGYITEMEAMSRGLNLAPGFVPQTTFWLISDKNRIIGISRLRQILTPRLLNDGGNIGYFVARSERNKGIGTELLRLTIMEAKRMNIQDVLLTPNSDNLGSIRVIEKNGGILEDERTRNNEKYRRYWIKNIQNKR